MSKIEITKKGNEIGNAYKVKIDDKDISALTTSIRLYIAPYKSEASIELAFFDEPKVTVEGEIEISNIQIPEELFDKILSKMLLIKAESNARFLGVDYGKSMVISNNKGAK